MFPISPDSPTPILHLRGVKHPARRVQNQRNASFIKQLASDELQLWTRSLLDDIIETRVRSREVPAEARPVRFHRLNRPYGLWYHPDLMDDFLALAEDLRQALTRRARFAAAWDLDVNTLVRIHHH